MKAQIILQLAEPEEGLFAYERAIDGDTLVGTIVAYSSALLVAIPVLAVEVQAAPVRVELAQQGIRLWSAQHQLGIDCPEKTGDTKAAGLAALAFTLGWVTDHKAHDHRGYLQLQMIGRDSFRRVLSDVVCTIDGSFLASELLASGNATFWTR